MDGTSNKKKIWQRLQDTYRIIILDDENLEEVGSYHLSLLSFYVLLSVSALTIALLVISFVFFTPVKRLIPGYGDISDNRKFIELAKKVDALESEVTAYQVYIDGLQKILTASAGDTDSGSTDKIASTKPTSPELVNKADIKETSRTIELNFLKFATPIYGKVSAGFQPDVQHYGVDILAPKDTPIKAIMDGIVISADQSVKNGNSIYIQHNKNVVSVYKHNSALLVKTGDIVKTGQAIAIIGNTGEQSTGPHLHFEMWYDGKYVNPQNYITFQ